MVLRSLTRRRPVRVDQAFFDDLDHQLGIELDLDWPDEQVDRQLREWDLSLTRSVIAQPKEHSVE